MSTVAEQRETAASLASKWFDLRRAVSYISPDDELTQSNRQQLRELIEALHLGCNHSLVEFIPAVEFFAGGEHGHLQDIAKQLEAFPIDATVDDYTWRGFALVAGEWIPCYNLEINPQTGWAMAGFRHNGQTGSMACPPGDWAECTADNLPSLPWTWDDDRPLPTNWLK